MRNPFGVLGLEASADADQVRAAYRKLVKRNPLLSTANLTSRMR